MSRPSEKKSLAIILSVFLFVIVGTYFVTLFARGYRPNFQGQNGLTFNPTGLLSATSKPKGASVYIDNRLVTATDDTINLAPGNYLLKIVKDGFLSWQKTIKIKQEIVYQSDAQLFRSAPDLSPVTLSGALNPTISPDNSRIIFAVASASATRDNGLYLIELTNSPLSLNKNSPRQIAPNSIYINWSEADFTFSPNSRQVLASFKNPLSNYLLNLDSPININSLIDITPKLSIIKSQWTTQDQELIQIRLNRLPLDLQPLIATDSASLITYSSGEDKVLYLAKTDSELPSNLISPPPAQSTQVQTRRLKKDHYYIYDLNDDTNYLLGSKNSFINPFWLPNSNNIIFVEKQSIKAIDYDATNQVTLFTGDFDVQNVFPWSDGSRIITLTSAYSGPLENLYSITIR